jgi:hypothetical protein
MTMVTFCFFFALFWFPVLGARASFFEKSFSPWREIRRRMRAVSRNEQTVDFFCGLIMEGGLFPEGCVCGAHEPTGELQLVCDEFCEFCLDDEDFCVVYSLYSRLNLVGFTPTFNQIREDQRGADSSQKILRLEQTFGANGQLDSCKTFINDEECDSCTLIDECQEGAIHDCRNIAGIDAVVNVCNIEQLQNLPLNHPFATQAYEDVQFAACLEGQGPEEPDELIPKKQVPLDSSKDDTSKIFNEFDIARGGLNRRLKVRGS